MARPRKFDDETLLDATLSVVARDGHNATITTIATELDAPVGSLYHRISGRDELLGRVWLREVGEFQRGLLPLIRMENPNKAIDAGVRHIPRWCDAHRASARALTLFRQDDLVSRTDGEVRERAIHVNDNLNAAMLDLAKRRFARVTENRVALLRVACQQVPYDLIRPHVGGAIPEWLEDAAVAAAQSVINRG